MSQSLPVEDTAQKEFWRQIAKEPNYDISSLGNVRNRDTNRIKSTRFDKYGYPRVTLYPSGKTYTIHRLIMENFTHERQPHINHIDNNRANSVLSNLEWCTAKENVAHIHTQGRGADVSGCKNPMAKVSKEEAYAIKYLHPEMNHREVGTLYNVSRMCATRIRKNESWKGL